MADQNEAKTKTIGYLPIDKVQTLKGWDEYLDKSTKLSVLRTEAQKAKNSVRDALKERLNEDGDIDFVGEGDRIRVQGLSQAAARAADEVLGSVRVLPGAAVARTRRGEEPMRRCGRRRGERRLYPRPEPHDRRRCGHARSRNRASHGHHAREGAEVAPRFGVSVARMGY
jgi:hypothetical protein